jgi:organic hydroperoxide reductase OsmC/OhrA
MSNHDATIHWQLADGEAFTDNRYSRNHSWSFDGGSVVIASASPSVVPVPMSSPAAVDPEEAFVASVSSCHMLWFLSIAAKRASSSPRTPTRHAARWQGTPTEKWRSRGSICRPMRASAVTACRRMMKSRPCTMPRMKNASSPTVFWPKWFARRLPVDRPR